MDSAGPSHTALITAYARAYHQIADTPAIFTDGYASALLGITADGLTELGTRRDDPVGAVVSDRARRLFFATRARVAEDAIAAAAAAGTDQVVILGAGLDTFAYRNRNPHLQVFEVDHPATQAWKRDRLVHAGLEIPATVTYVPLDFETQDLAAELESAGFRRFQPALFVWLGVIYYLTPEAAHATLEFVAGQSSPVEIVFDYLRPADTVEDRAHLKIRADRLAGAGEPLLRYSTPDDTARLLRTLGFTEIDDRAADHVIGTYLGESPEWDDESARTLRASRILRARR